MRKYKEMKRLIDTWNDTQTFPVLDCDKYVDFYKEFPLFRVAPLVIRRNVRVSLDKIYGNNWVFQDISQRGSYPSFSKLDSLLRGFTRTHNDFFKKRKIPPVPLTRILGNWYLEEGNHRIYLSKLLGKKFIIADVEEYDYEDFLANSDIFQNDYGSYIVYLNQIHQVSEDELLGYRKKK